MFWLSLLLATVTLGGVFAAPSTHLERSSTHVSRDGVVALPHGWVQHRDAHPDTSLSLRIALPQSNFAELERILFEVSDPEHANYGNHLTQQEVDELVRPHAHSVEAVDRWLESFGVVGTKNPAGDWVKIRVPVSKAEKMFDCKFHVFKHPETGYEMVRTYSYGVPKSLDSHIEIVQPTTSFSRPRAMKSLIIDDAAVDHETSSATNTAALSNAVPAATIGGTRAAPACNSSITLQCLRDLYGIGDYKSKARTGNIAGITGYLEQNANYEDFRLFTQKYVPEAYANNYTFSYTLVNNATNDQSLENAGIEADLDVQYVGGLSYPIPNNFISTGGRPPYIPDALGPTQADDDNEPYLQFTEYVESVPRPPSVVSTSYTDDEQTVPRDYAVRVCQQFAKLGARGISLIFGSGDGGVGGAQTPPYCASNDGKNRTEFIPTFPSSCPYITAVGGTRYIYPEIGVTFSGGGFSNYFRTPIWQKLAVGSYLDKQLGPRTYKGLYNPRGRGIPDVAFQGVRFHVFSGGKEVNVSGTSASTPGFSGVVALLNDARLKEGKKTLGWLNPWLYTLGKEGLTDIVKGNNPGCGTTGFNATVGWDPITGLGTPNFPKLLKLATLL